ncbi:FAD-dependent oxidoreductase [Peribacillus sp. TH16]|uniref:NAD(P)/FAD-dependent oxidoreductase n=1 Tax=Peribacillus sp. TH16 TaxID=2798482 RepID=UPI001912FD2A|nr:FAD-dependent oxidoreductase [Peribacillus sp. TH16]MBK5482708.1 FAD-dependent oxidoreductase [Peribacillus sp. TH16]
MAEFGMVIVGAGEAGARAAVELRTHGWTGPVTLIGEEKRAPYERPPLSKDCLVTEEEPSTVDIINHRKLAQLDVNFLSGSVVTEIDRNNQSLILGDGQQIRYERLLLATGSRPRRLSIEGSDLLSLLYLRTFADAIKIRTQLEPGKHVAVIGGGFIGLEVAASAIKRGCSVTLVEAGPRILTRGVPEEIAYMVEARHSEAGVVFKLGVGIKSIETSDEGHVIALSDGTFVHCDTVIAGIGAIPETSLAAQCGLEIENGIRVSEKLATSDPNIFAAGDCCSFPHPLYGGKRIRLEAWRNAQDQGTHAARSMLDSIESYAAVPWFWSDQYEQNLQVIGLVDCGEKTIIRDLGKNGKLFFHLSTDGRLVAASGIGAASITKDIRIAEILIEKQVKVESSDLENPKVKLKGLLRLQNI